MRKTAGRARSQHAEAADVGDQVEGAAMEPALPEIADYLAHLAKERDVSPNTVVAYSRDLAAFVDYLGRYFGGARPRPMKRRFHASCYCFTPSSARRWSS